MVVYAFTLKSFNKPAPIHLCKCNEQVIIKRLQIVIVLLIVLSLGACQKEADLTDASQRPVVVGYLLPGSQISIKIYQQKLLTDTAVYGPKITGLQLTLSDGTSTVSLSETAAGTYTYNDLSFLKAGKTYTLSFSYLNALVTASTLMPAKPLNFTASRTSIAIPVVVGDKGSAVDSVAIHFRWSNPESLYHVLVFKNDDISPWNIHPTKISPVNFTINAQRADSYDVYYQTFNYIGTYRAILLSVNQEYINNLTVSELFNATCGDKAVKLIIPYNLTGTPQELDEAFFTKITEPVAKSAELQTNLEAHLKSVEEAKAASKMEQDRKNKEKAQAQANAKKTVDAEIPEPKISKEEKKKAYDTAMENVNELIKKLKFSEALTVLPTVEEHPHKENELKKKRQYLEQQANLYEKALLNFNA